MVLTQPRGFVDLDFDDFVDLDFDDFVDDLDLDIARGGDDNNFVRATCASNLNLFRSRIFATSRYNNLDE